MLSTTLKRFNYFGQLTTKKEIGDKRGEGENRGAESCGRVRGEIRGGNQERRRGGAGSADVTPSTMYGWPTLRWP
jgi:hypothetical protein